MIIGSGSIGLMMPQLVKLQGAAKVLLTGTTDFRLETAKKIGVDHVFNTRDSGSPFTAPTSAKPSGTLPGASGRPG